MDHDVIYLGVIFVKLNQTCIFVRLRLSLSEFLQLCIEWLHRLSLNIYLRHIWNFAKVIRYQVHEIDLHIFLVVSFRHRIFILNRIRRLRSSNGRLVRLTHVFFEISCAGLLEKFDQVFCILVLLVTLELILELLELDWSEILKVMTECLDIVFTVFVDENYQLICSISNFF